MNYDELRKIAEKFIISPSEHHEEYHTNFNALKTLKLLDKLERYEAALKKIAEHHEHGAISAVNCYSLAREALKEGGE